MFYTHRPKLISSVDNPQFLPPVSRWTSLAGIFLIGTVTSAIALASWVKYNVTVKVDAVVRPIGEVRVVQPEVEGTIKSILVKPNQTVKIGDVIAYLNTDDLLIKKSQLQGNIQQGNLQISQVYAQIRILDRQILAETQVAQNAITSARVDLLRNQREYEEQQVSTQGEFLAAQANWQKAKASLDKARADLSFAKMDKERYQELSQIGAVGRRELEQKALTVQQTQSILDTERKSLEMAKIKVQSAQAAINPTPAAVMIAQERIAQETARGVSNIASLNKEKQALIERRVQLETQIKQSIKELEQVENQMRKSMILATSNGIILKLNLRNPGQVIRPSESIAEIVPDSSDLLIRALIPTEEIQKVNIGQQVQLRVGACPYPDYGTLQGVVQTISPDVITNQSNNQGTTNRMGNGYFEATVKPASLQFGHGRHQCYLQSGMEVKADIISKQETALEFMFRKARLITDL
ncbi:HlyD family secretion protein [Cylindrospermopsis curvispora]|uniref:HlyD family efflux transporter periplasmic adaptor subunit n=1 Tax=Cylindrospermopsis curvispora GIHE-G1 TaxID=2666332 RepID=A0A7H0F419_9CYAN|nr:HlyD family efflux transporter periplasmic adaptor subunit [Cylindrospermopsis curvispora]MBU6345854.1 HlyD family efflux transporter periplasmic adaptor subunit [Cyanobacteria bacterium REEB494]QNP30785.1 HlyD family efflux transporter periplasmic adaptor subunit [Cylindrospermopsis curvispora GIHE-G1]